MLRKMSDPTDIRQRKPRRISRDNSFCVLNNAELYRKLVTDDNSLPVKHSGMIITRERTKISRSDSHILSNTTGKYSLNRTVKDTGSARRPLLKSSPRYRLAEPETPRSILKKTPNSTKCLDTGGKKSIQKHDSDSNEGSDEDSKEPRFSYRLGPVQTQSKRVSFHPSANAEPQLKNSSYALNPNVRFVHPILNSTFYKLPDIVRCRIVHDSSEDISKKRKS